MPIVGQTISPVAIRSERLLRVLDVLLKPRQHVAQRGALVERLVAFVEREREGLADGPREPWMALVDVATEREHVHDREDLRLGEVGLLDLDEVRKEMVDGATAERRRPRCAVEGVDLAVAEHMREALAGTDRRDFDRRRQTGASDRVGR